MKRGLMGILAVGMTATAANAAVLSMRFAGGGNEVTLAPSQSATIEVVITMGTNDGPKTPSKLTGFDMRFEVGDLAFNPDAAGDAGAGDGRYVVDGSTKYMVTEHTAFPGWGTAAASTLPAAFNGNYFLSVGDPDGNIGPTGATIPSSAVIATFTIHKETFEAGDTYVAWRKGAALPALYNGAATWGDRFGYTTEVARNQFLHGQGSPGDNNPSYDPYHGYETFEALIIHNVPEPSALALLALGGLAMLRRRK